MMKQLFFILMLAIAATAASCSQDDVLTDETTQGGGQTDGIPQAVLDKFNEMFPDASDVAWSRRHDAYAVATFTLPATRANSSARGGRSMAWFDWNSGGWGMTEYELPYALLPQQVKSAFEASNYARNPWRVKNEVDYLYRGEGAESLYVIEVEKREQGVETEVKLYYTESGSLVKEISEVDTDYDHHEYFPQALPEAIQAYLKQNHPGANIIDIDYERTGTEVEIIADGQKHDLYFTASGTWNLTKTEYERRHLDRVDQKVMQSLGNAYDLTDNPWDNSGAWFVEEAERYVTAERTYWRFELEKTASPWEDEQKVYIDADGKILSGRPGSGGTGGGTGGNTGGGGTGGNTGIPVETDIEAVIAQKYPGAVITDRDYDDGCLEIEIWHEGVEKDVKFNGRNEWVKTEYDLRRFEQLPEAVQSTLLADADFNRNRVDGIEVKETPARTVYEVETDLGRMEIKYLIAADGTLLHKEYDD